MAALLGAHNTGPKPPRRPVSSRRKPRRWPRAPTGRSSRTASCYVVRASFAGRRIVVFLGGAAKGADALYQDARDIRDGGGNGSIIGRNTFQRLRDEALAMLDKLVRIYKNEVVSDVPVIGRREVIGGAAAIAMIGWSASALAAENARCRHDRQDHGNVRPGALSLLDEGLRRPEWSAHAALARHHGLQQNAGTKGVLNSRAGRGGRSGGEQKLHSCRPPRGLRAQGGPGLDAPMIRSAAAQGQLVALHLLWLAILIEGARYRLPKAALQRFPPLWEAGLAKKGKSETAGAMALLLSIYPAADVKYTGRSTHVQQVAAYLKRASESAVARMTPLAVIAFSTSRASKPRPCSIS